MIPWSIGIYLCCGTLWCIYHLWDARKTRDQDLRAFVNHPVVEELVMRFGPNMAYVLLLVVYSVVTVLLWPIGIMRHIATRIGKALEIQ